MGTGNRIFKLKASFPFLEGTSSHHEQPPTFPAVAPVMGVVLFLKVPWQ